MAACDRARRDSRGAGRAGVPRLQARPTEATFDRHNCVVLRRPGSRPHRQVFGRHRRALRGLQRLRRHHHRQANGALRVHRAVALRGTVSTGFRAPSLQQQYFQSTATNFIGSPAGNTPFDVPPSASTNPAAIALGAEPLQPEESTNYSLGLVLQPIERLYITIDAYRIDIEDRIVAVREPDRRRGQQLPGRERLLRRHRRPLFHQRHRHPHRRHRRGRHLWLGPRQRQCRPDRQLQPHQDHDRPDRAQPAGADRGRPEPRCASAGSRSAASTVGAPRDKFLLGGLWNSGNWEFSGNAPATARSRCVDASPRRSRPDLRAEWTLDLAATYKLDRWSFTLGGDNVTNEYPDEVLFANSHDGQIPYDRSAVSFGFSGAFMYGKAGYKW